MACEVLIVDDSSFMRTMLSKIFKTIPEIQKIHEADNGPSAIEIYKKIKPNIVTMDIDMPKMDGITATKKIISFDSKAKIVMVTSVEKTKTRSDAESAGACGFIKKPFQVTEIKKIIGKIPK